MILIASILGGSAIGYLVGAKRRGTQLFLVLWLLAFGAQTVFLLTVSDDIRNRNTGRWSLASSRSRSPYSPSASPCCTRAPPSDAAARRVRTDVWPDETSGWRGR